MPSPIVDLGVVPGHCVAGFGQGARSMVVVPCDQTHDGEVDLDPRPHDRGAVVAGDPGAGRGGGSSLQRRHHPAGRRSHGLRRRLGRARPVVVESSAWTLTCVLVRDDFTSWTGPSGIVPTTPADVGPPAPGETISDFDRVPVGTCLRFLTPTSPGAAMAVEVAGCEEPHSGELFHTFVLVGEPGAPFPGTGRVEEEAAVGCAAGFSVYVGLSIEQSRPTFLTRTRRPRRGMTAIGRSSASSPAPTAVPLDRSMAGSGE